MFPENVVYYFFGLFFINNFPKIPGTICDKKFVFENKLSKEKDKENALTVEGSLCRCSFFVFSWQTAISIPVMEH